MLKAEMHNWEEVVHEGEKSLFWNKRCYLDIVNLNFIRFCSIWEY